MPVQVIALMLMVSTAVSGSGSPVLVRDRFDRPNGLITNEYAYHHPDKPAVRSHVWQVTSGSFFARNRAGWTGVPDDRRPDANSSTGTGSAVFRLVTRRADLKDVAFSFKLVNAGLRPSRRASDAAWTGVHAFLRYQNERWLYVVSVNRRDDTVTIKKKVPGGPSNGGTYYTLAAGDYRVPYGRRQNVSTTIRTTARGWVAITLEVDGRRLLQATDAGRGGRPITAAGRVGIRGDGCEFLVDDVVATRYP
jgi:hypothetical protein